MANDLLDQIPEWLKSRNGLILRKDEALNHLSEARRHFEEALKAAKGVEPSDGPKTPLRKEGEI